MSAPFFLGPNEEQELAFTLSGSEALYSMKYFSLSECVVAVVVHYRSPTERLLHATHELARMSESSDNVIVSNQKSEALTSSVETKPQWVYATMSISMMPPPTAGPVPVPVSPR